MFSIATAPFSGLASSRANGRAAAEVAELATEVDAAKFLRRTGNGVNQQLIATKLRWLERHEPDVFARIHTVFGSYDYVNWRLTGRRGVERNWALEAGLVDLADHEIHDDLVALTHVARDAFPALHDSKSVFGAVTTEAAAATGLPEGLAVFGGAADHIASALAAGLVNPGDVLLKFGGAGDIVVASDVARPDWRLFLDYHLVPGLYAPNGCMAASGSALNWLADAHPVGARRRRKPPRRLRPARGRGPAGQRRGRVPALFPGREDAGSGPRWREGRSSASA